MYWSVGDWLIDWLRCLEDCWWLKFDDDCVSDWWRVEIVGVLY